MRREFPGFIDVHVHFRDPGMPEAETSETGLAAAAAGGFAAVVAMPNTTPAGDSVQWLRRNAKIDGRGGPTRLWSSACITRGRLGLEVADLETLAEAGAAFFTDDGTYVADAKVLEEAMRRSADLNRVICQHALCADMSEEECIRRDLSVCRETGCRLHIQHLSTAAGVELVREAMKEGLPVTAEATPHHLLLCRDDIRWGATEGNFKMAPPLATAEDRAELRRAVRDGLFMFATDHAPHPVSKKLVAYAEAANGIVGLETAIPITYRVMVEEEGMRAEDWARAWWEKPRDILPHEFDFAALRPTAVEIGAKRKVDVWQFNSRSRNCPYDGMEFDCFSLPISPDLGILE